MSEFKDISGITTPSPLPQISAGDTVVAAAVSTRKRGKCMSRRKGQSPKLEIKNGMYTFRYRVDVAGAEGRRQVRQVIGSVKSMTKSEAELSIKDFLVTHGINRVAAKIPSVLTFRDAVKYYREVFAPRMLRPSTFSGHDGLIKNHLEADWNDVPIEHINIDSVNEWAWKQRERGLSWTLIKDILRKMQRVVSCSSKDRRPPFSQKGLTIPEKDKLQMQIDKRRRVSYSWNDTKRIVSAVNQLDTLDDSAKEKYAMAFILADATGLRPGELFALRVNDVNFASGTIRVDESLEQTTFTVGPCKNAAAYRNVLLLDREGKEALRMLKGFLKGKRTPTAFVFHSRNGSPLRESNVLRYALHPALAAAGLPKGGMHAYRRGCNRRWELAGMNPAVLRQMMGHSSSTMTALYTGEIPLELLRIVTACDPKRSGLVA